MRIARLDLVAYGHFDAFPLDFAPAGMDLHLIMGANEAGKSTTLAAVADLLFGFPKSTPYNFRHDNELLRIGAVLDDGGRQVALQRRKGTKNTLLDAAGAVLPDATLAPLLHGLTREAFHRGYALDHRRLREGGHAMLQTDGDVGQALVAAGAGLTGVQRVLEALRAECDAIWAERRSLKRSHAQAAEALDAATRRLRAAEVRPREWLDVTRALDQLRDEQQALRRQIDTLERAHRRVQRIRRLAAPVRQRQQRHEAAKALAPSPFDPASEAAFAAALETVRANTAAAATAAAEVTSLREGAESHAADDPVLARADAVGTLAETAAVARKAATDLAGLSAGLAGFMGAVDGLVAELGWPAADLAALPSLLPPRPLLAKLDPLTAQAATLAAQRAKAEADRQAAARRVEDGAAALTRLPAVVDDQPLALALRRAQQSLPRHEGLIARRRTLARAMAEREAGLGRLAPWQGSVEALHAIVVPPAAEIDEAARALDQTQQAMDAAGRDAALAAESMAALRLDAGRFSAGGAVTEAALLALRSTRDAALAALRAQLRGDTPPDDTAPGDDRTGLRLETAIRQADALADQRFERAEASARLAALDHDHARQTLLHMQAETRRTAARHAQNEAEAAWTRRLAQAGLPAMRPDTVRQWGQEQAAVRGATEAVAEAEAALAADLAAVEEAAAGLEAAAPQQSVGLPRLPRLPRLIDAAEAALALRSRDATMRVKLQTQVQSARDSAAAAAAQATDLAAAQSACQQAWGSLVHGTALQGIEVADGAAVLALVRELREALGKATDRAHRMAEIQADLTRFEREATELAAACGQAPDGSGQATATALTARLARALEANQARRTLDERRASQEERQRNAERAVAAARLQLAPLETVSGSRDLVVLGAALDQYTQRRADEAAIRTADAAILADGDGLDLAHLLNEVAGADQEALVAEDAAMARAIAEQQALAVAGGEALGAAETRLKALDHGADAAEAAADVAQAKAAVEAEAEAYLERRTQAVLLAWAIERYRERHQSPMLARAGAVFHTLTLGRYTELRLGLEEEAPRLVALRDGRAVPVGGMSEGTADQLFLALRLAAFEQSLADGAVLPFLADDLFVNFDDARAEAGFRVLGELARRTQVLFFTHHDHLRAIAERALHPDIVYARALGSG